ncbi:hypothetical protein QE361_003601 [Sphingomonas sp. SORGH_AS802]|jgi:hypothetical protein|uniref:hypothetical protein n=1 Tax=unclassified Sphingomonas TaxID=196159 RepID=UPI00285D28E6|nr:MULTISPECIES: hypothetical protein [unclassified Sphingomonas]MDR6126101.1 hypothetical protein [Sphingomonas sp. SORGH_AS_0438]MDR6136593.1 hypothetical protein [Sphingomonas sp. SORGH_AS_0802]
MTRTASDHLGSSPDPQEVSTHSANFMAAYNFAGWCKTFSGLTAYKSMVCPIHHMPGHQT